MTNYEIGYGKPPLNGRFRAGVSGNPKGRPKHRPIPFAEVIKNTLNAPIEYQEQGRTKVMTYRELSLKRVVDKAAGGNLDAAELILKILEQTKRFGDPGVEPILVENWIADYPDQTASQKKADFATARDARPDEWWQASKD